MQTSIVRIKMSVAGFLISHNGACCSFGCCPTRKASPARFFKRFPNNSKRKTLRTYRDGYSYR